MNLIGILKYFLFTDLTAKVIVPFLSAFIGFLGALAIYVLRNKHVRKSEERKCQQLHWEKLKYFSALLSVIVQSTRLQIDEQEKYIKLLAEKPFDFHYFNIVVNESLKRVSERTDQSEIYHANSVLLARGREDTPILKCLRSIDFLHQISYQIKDYHQKNAAQIEMLEKEYRELSETILDKTSTEIHIPRYQGGLKNTGFDKFIKKLTDNYYSQVLGKETIELRQEHFIEPFISKYPAYKDELLMKEVVVDLKNCRHLYNEIIQSVEFIANTLSEFKTRQKESLNNIDKYLKVLKENGFGA
jgi:hypothetical protein